MKGKYFTGILCCAAALLLAGGKARAEEPGAYTRESRIQDVMQDPAFGDYGRLLFPVEDWYYSGNTLEELRLVYYSHIDPDETVEIVNTLRAGLLPMWEPCRTVFPMRWSSQRKATMLLL